MGGNLCINGSCGKKDEGSTCETDAQCKSTFCRDRVCCEGACAGNCRTCNAAGKAGKCTLSASGDTDPRGVCTDARSPACKTDGKCDGSGSCRNYPAGIECVAQSCNAGTNMGDFRHECNGSGTCAKTKDPVSCAPGRCGGNACTLQCSKTEDCVAPNTCVGNLCGKKPLGQTCNTPSECQSGNCADGFCCDEACTGACKACDASGSVGKCSLVAAGQPDPNGVCAATPGGTCGTSGLCNAGGGCAYHSAATSCGTATCNAAIGTFTPAPRCNGSGTCGNVSQMGCNRFACNSNGCLTSCAGNGDCANGSACVGGQCVQKVADGNTCAGDAECVSGACRTYYFDEDKDGFGRMTGEKLCGTVPPASYQSASGDCCDIDKHTHPPPFGTPSGSPYKRFADACKAFDFDCSGAVEKVLVHRLRNRINAKLVVFRQHEQTNLDKAFSKETGVVDGDHSKANGPRKRCAQSASSTADC